MLTLAIDYTPAYEQGGGIGRYVRELVQALAAVDNQNTYRLFVSGTPTHRLPAPPGPNFTWASTRLSPRWMARLWHRTRVPLPVEVFTGKIQLYHATDFVLPPTRQKTRTLLTVHDLSFVRVPEAASPRLKAYLDTVVPRSLQRADHVLADSQSTKDDIVEIYGLSPTRITPLLSGVSPQFKPLDHMQVAAVRHKYGLGDTPFILSVGTVQPRKNYARLVQALRLLRDHNLDINLVISGGKGWLEDSLYAAIAETGLTNAVRLIGFAAESDLPALYNAATCFAFPSLYEGFGLPVLEAMACGTPVMTSDISSLPEVAGDAALLVDPYNVDAITEALYRLITDTVLRNQLIQRGQIHADSFTWERAARQLRTIYEHLTGT